MIKNFNKLTNTLLDERLLSQINDILVLTDVVDYPNVDQVFPMYPEQPFFLDEIDQAAMKGANVLEIGLGSGILSIGALKAGAKRATALEINPRAKVFAGFNAVLNGVAGGLRIVDGNIDNIWQPVRGQTFDMVISNPPFMPTPPDSAHYFHSGGGDITGMDFVEKILQQLDAHLSDEGHAQIVTAAPGDAHLPTLLISMAEKYLCGSCELVIDPLRLHFDVLTHHLPEDTSNAKMLSATKELISKDITHQYLCVLHYQKCGSKSMSTRFSQAHANWDMPLNQK